jgi:hypothetical protein
MEAVVPVAAMFAEPLISPVLCSSSAHDQKPGVSTLTGPGRSKREAGVGVGDGATGAEGNGVVEGRVRVATDAGEEAGRLAR